MAAAQKYDLFNSLLNKNAAAHCGRSAAAGAEKSNLFPARARASVCRVRFTPDVSGPFPSGRDS